MKIEKIYITNPDGVIVVAYYDFNRGVIQSHTKGGVKTLREWGWDIQKKEKRWHPKTELIMKQIEENKNG